MFKLQQRVLLPVCCCKDLSLFRNLQVVLTSRRTIECCLILDKVSETHTYDEQPRQHAQNNREITETSCKYRAHHTTHAALTVPKIIIVSLNAINILLKFSVHPTVM
jgi:hypothetical protein